VEVLRKALLAQLTWRLLARRHAPFLVPAGNVEKILFRFCH
jgi:hypothetical protein